MAVLLADRQLGVRARVLAPVDAHGDRFPASWGPLQGPWPGRAMEGPDTPEGQAGDRTWRLAVDPMAWPLHQGDLVEEIAWDGAVVRRWLVMSADLIHHSWYAEVNYVRVEGNAHAGDTVGGTSP